jgi:hypothetical protein
MNLNGTALSATATTLVVSGPAGGLAAQINGASTGTTVGLALSVLGSGTANALSAFSNSGTAVSGSSGSGAGVQGSTSGNGANAVAGTDNSATGGTGVYGASTHGIGVRALSTSGTALHVTGKVHFSRAGSTGINKGQQTIAITVPGLSSSSLVLATLQRAAAGLFLEAAVPTTGKFTVILNKPAPIALRVAWFVIN